MIVIKYLILLSLLNLYSRIHLINFLMTFIGWSLYFRTTVTLFMFIGIHCHFLTNRIKIVSLNHLKHLLQIHCECDAISYTQKKPYIQAGETKCHSQKKKHKKLSIKNLIKSIKLIINDVFCFCYRISIRNALRLWEKDRML